ncbi:class I SAM-dependent methyltransferase [Chelatococcus sp. GCM10030263]|uniref:class I SAM-dependent methyltransferase n=1 Tax=Chelatococcus sp. GCM10030263 TaxID=3273387 RepID=UPI003607A5BE
MADWTDGYVTEVGYTHGFYRELLPLNLRLAALTAGFKICAPTRYLELGCGQGFSANLIAATHPDVAVTAVDFNPAHIAEAEDLARRAGIDNIELREASFAEIAGDGGPATYDIIALHGIYSWVSPENRAFIRDIVRQRLKTGGLLYVSYNALPGWAAAAPLRHLIAETAAHASGAVADRFDAARAFAERLHGAKARYFSQNPMLAERLSNMAKHQKNYLVHEYLNTTWTPFYSTDVQRDFGEAKLTYAAQANLTDGVDLINFTKEQREILADIKDAPFRELIGDIMLNRQFRRDVFIRGGLAINASRQMDEWLDVRVALTTAAEGVELKVNCGLGRVTLQEPIYRPIIASLSDGPKTVQDLMEEPSLAEIGWARARQALMILIGQGSVSPALPAAGEDIRAIRTARFNDAVIDAARFSGKLGFLASPVTGSGIPVDRIGQLALLARRDSVNDSPAFIWSMIAAQGQRLMKDGKPLDAEADNHAAIASRIATFNEEQLPLLTRLGVAQA